MLVVLTVVRVVGGETNLDKRTAGSGTHFYSLNLRTRPLATHVTDSPTTPTGPL